MRRVGLGGPTAKAKEPESGGAPGGDLAEPGLMEET